MICPKCSYTLTLLFTSTACDRCDGLLKQEAAQPKPNPERFEIGQRVFHVAEPLIIGTVDAVDYTKQVVRIDWAGTVYSSYDPTWHTFRTIEVA